MQEIRLTKLLIRNFKGIRELDILFLGKDINVLGDNGTGKTTIIDSFTWLLFGKDSLGRADFGIKPTDKAGNIIHQLETSVEAVFDISGDTKVFKKTLSEVWTRKRGAAEAEFSKNENSYYIDGVPKKKSEYTAAIKELIDEEVFKIITNPLYFNESVNWKDRRSVLLNICGKVSDADVFASNEALAPLLPLLNGKSVSDFKDITASTMKRINRELDMIPVKINEAELAKPNPESLEADFVKEEKLSLAIEALRIQKSDILNGNKVAQERQSLYALKERLSSVGRDFAPSLAPESAKIAALQNEISELVIHQRQEESRKKLWLSELEEKTQFRERLSVDWDKVFNVRFTNNACPTCGRELPEEEVEKRRKEFNIDKAKRLDDIEAQNEKVKGHIEQLERSIEDCNENIATIESKLSELNASLETAKTDLNVLIATKKSEFDKERSGIEAEIAEVELRIAEYQGSTAGAVADIDTKIFAMSRELSVIHEATANRALLERQDKRIGELKEQQVALAAEYNRVEKGLYLAEQFIVTKVNMLNERINQKFRYAKFKLFESQINGGINEVCEVTYEGIPYKDLNNAMRINIGLDVINTIAAYYGVTCPILIDNAESVNEIFHTEAQQIRFYVSQDKRLVFNEA